MAERNADITNVMAGKGLARPVAAAVAIVFLDSTANFVPVNTADNWLHLVLAVVMIGAGLALRSMRTERV